METKNNTKGNKIKLTAALFPPAIRLVHIKTNAFEFPFVDIVLIQIINCTSSLKSV